MSAPRIPIELPQFAADDPRLGTLLGTAWTSGVEARAGARERNGVEARAGARERNDEAARVSIVGFAVDQGVERNGGRPGAREAPQAVRDKLYRMCPDPRAFAAWAELLGRTRDLGDIPGTGDLERDQEALGERVARELAAGRFVIVLGGGHETSYGHFLGYVRAGLRVAVQNIDAHADVRPLEAGLGHSGSPFRQILEHPSRACSGYAVAGLQPNAVASAHLAYLSAHGARAVFRDAFAADQLFGARSAPTLATFCLDALDQAYAPGVSAPASDGLTAREWLGAAFRAGACPSVRSFDLVELNPRFDRDGQSARLAARTVWELLRGLLARKAL